MARIETDPNYSAPTFPRATAATDLFKKEDVQKLAEAMSGHDHTTGKGVALAAGSIPNGTITSAMIADGTIDTADLKDGAVTSAKIADGTIATVDLADRSVTNIKLASDTARANLLTNGSLAIAQRGSGPFTANSVLVCDRWQMSMGAGSTYSCSANQPLGSASPSGGSVTGITGSYVHAANSYLVQTLKFSDMGAHLRLTQVAYSMRVFANAANAVRLRISGDGTGISPATSSFHPGNSTWQTLTVISNVIPADANSVIAQIEFAATVSSWSACMGMLVPGSVPADYAPLHPADDLARCLRYYEVLGESTSEISIYASNSSAAGVTGWYSPFKARKAGTPTVTKLGTWGVTNCGQPVVGNAGFGGTSLYITATSAGNVYTTNSAGCSVVAESNP
jgi:hypothetical protein